MQFTQATLLFIAATGILANPLGARNPDLTEFSSTNTADGGALEGWGRRDIEARDPDVLKNSQATKDGGVLEGWGKRSDSPLAARWGGGTKCATGTITPVCDNSDNEAENALCDSLISNLNGYGTQAIPSDWRQVCYKGQSGKCCTAWSGTINSLTYGDLVSGAQTMSQACSNNGISGKMNGMKIEGTCVNQCLNSGHSCGA